MFYAEFLINANFNNQVAIKLSMHKRSSYLITKEKCHKIILRGEYLSFDKKKKKKLISKMKL